MVMTNLALIALVLVTGADLLWGLVLVVWLNLVIYCLRSFSQRVYYFAFLLAFFIFLLGRVTMSELFAYEPVAYEDPVFLHLCVALTVALIGSFLGHILLAAWQRKRGEKGKSAAVGWDASDPRAVGVRQAAGIIFWATFPFALYYEFDRVRLVLTSGYADLYSEAFRSSAATGEMALVGQAALANVAAMAIFLAAMPTLKRARPVMIAWFLLIALSLGSGQRSTFITGCLFLLCYAVMRNRVTPEDRWITRRAIVPLVLMVPALVLVFAAVETLRGVGNEYTGNPFEIVMSFLYNQGVSSTVITNAYVYAERIPPQPFLFEFAHSGLLARAFDIPVFQGNSIDRALAGGSFAHSLAFVVLGEASYLAGRGTGSSFVAEAFFGHGYVGVLLVAVLLGALLAFVEAARPGRLLLNSVGLLIVQDLFWAPRSSTTGFLSTLLAPSTLLTIFVIFLLGLAIAGRLRTPEPRGRPPLGPRSGGAKKL